MSWIRRIWSWATTLVLAFVLSSVIGIFVIQPYQVDGHSMDPTLHDNQRVYVSKLSHTFSYTPDYGDIVIIDSRVNRARSLKDDILENPVIHLLLNPYEHVFYIKRVIGKPGDVIEAKNHRVYRNGQELSEPYIKELMNDELDGSWTVPAGHVFVMGDNRNNSEDSRIIGPIPLDHVMGIEVYP